MAAKARIGIIGTGWWATTAHFPAVIAHPDAELAAAADIRPEVLAQAAAKYGAERTYTDYREMLDRENLDGVVVAVYHAAHFEVAQACLQRGLHVMLEKPMVLSADHARQLVELARRQNRELIVGYPWHYTPHTLRARELLQSGDLGEVRYINSMFASMVLALYRGEDRSYESFFQYPVVGPGDVYSDPERSGGGQGHLQVTHSAALIFFMTGLRPVTVMALMDNMDTRVDVTDACVARMDNGALVTVGSTGAIPANDVEQLETRIYCDRGWIDISSFAGTMRVSHPDRSIETLPPLEGEDEIYPMQATAANLVDVINGTAANGSPPEIGWRTVEFLDAAYRSAAKGGEAVEVDSLY